MSNLQVTPISQLVEYQQGQIVELPPFGENQPFIARLGRPSMLELVRSGKIPNSLIVTANRLFTGRALDDSKNDSAMSDIFDVLDALCHATFLEPKYQDLLDAGVKLTDQQYMAIFSYTQEGVTALEPFRGK